MNTLQNELASLADLITTDRRFCVWLVMYDHGDEYTVEAICSSEERAKAYVAKRSGDYEIEAREVDESDPFPN